MVADATDSRGLTVALQRDGEAVVGALVGPLIDGPA